MDDKPDQQTLEEKVDKVLLRSMQSILEFTQGMVADVGQDPGSIKEVWPTQAAYRAFWFRQARSLREMNLSGVSNDFLEAYEAALKDTAVMRDPKTIRTIYGL